MRKERTTVTCGNCLYFDRVTSTCHKAPPVRLPRKFVADATAGNRVRNESVEWGWPQISPGDWCGAFEIDDTQ